ncbi:acetate--CoA ligase family protein [Streptomyces sp. MBT65]|uniref:acetate--CoA ligase family protein n=1 Tax=Streptomyces sp. MBT65 TaxID=1488395 RepID=UPI00190ADE5F|nr:acetate--CoA ligase family protein [Streptomyces sp. MBT65]MBK3573905.1 acetate--CoA ligase family protein [Streptomyces sp. MBT65]
MTEPPRHTPGLSALLRPASVAVLGASARKLSAGNHVLRNLRRQDYAGDVHVVHPTAASIDGLAAVPGVARLPGGIDAAVVSLPAPAVMDALRQLEAAGCRSALVPTVGLDASTTRAFIDFARTSKMAVHGPNCMGFINHTDGIPLWIDTANVTGAEPGNVALIAQSGSAAIFVARSSGRVRFSKVVSSGGEYGLTTADYLSWLADDPATAAAGVVLESIRDLPSFVAGVTRMRQAGKPVVVLKVGRSAVGSAATTAHTGALVGSDAAYQALFERLDVPLVADYDELASVLQCLTVPDLPPAAGTRVGVITISGGQAALAADLAEARSVTTPAFTEPTVRALEEAMPGATVNNPYDSGASIHFTEEGYEQSIRLVLDDPEVDSVLVVLDGQATLTDDEVEYESDEYRSVRAVADQRPAKPLVVASSSSVSVHPACEALLGPSVPLLRGIGNGLVALRSLAVNQRPVPTDRKDDRTGGPHREAIRELRAQIAGHSGPLTAALSRNLLSRYGLPCVESAVVPDAEGAVRWASAHGYPVVVKVASVDVAHRSDLGGVVLDVKDEAALRLAVDGIRDRVSAARPDAVIDGFEIQRQVGDSTEAMIGFVSDPVFGAVTTVGTGGTLVELHRDTASALAPIDPVEARQVIARTRLGTVLDGYRNLQPKTDTGPLADAVHRLSLLAADFADLLAEGDLNPVFVEHGTGRVLIVDSLLVAHHA